MAATDSNENFLLFRNTLTKVERLVDVRGNLDHHTGAMTIIGEGIIYTMKLLTELDGNTSESNAIEELERLAMLKSKIKSQDYQKGISSNPPLFFKLDEIFDNMIHSKVDFIEKDSFNRLVSGGGVEPMAALERLAEVSKKLYRPLVDNLLVAKIKEVVYTPIPKASPKHDPVIQLLFTNRLQPHAQSTTVSSANIVAAPVYASQKQEILKRDLPSTCEESKTHAKFVSSPLSWLQDQDKAHTTDDDDSTEDGAALTPTSTIMSGMPEY